MSAPPCLWLTTLRPDGSPHTTPVWFVRDADVVWVATSRAAVKTRNLEHDPRVSLALDGTAAAPTVGEGRAVVHDLSGPRGREAHAAVLAAFAERYAGWDAADPSRYGARVLVEVVVERWLLRPGA